MSQQHQLLFKMIIKRINIDKRNILKIKQLNINKLINYLMFLIGLLDIF